MKCVEKYHNFQKFNFKNSSIDFRLKFVNLSEVKLTAGRLEAGKASSILMPTSECEFEFEFEAA